MTKQSITKILLTILISVMGANAFAYDIEVKNADGVTIYYNYYNDGKELEVTRNKNYDYGGSIVIPEEVTFMNRTRKVTSIGSSAFSRCSRLTSVTIPSSVASIGNGAFNSCSSLTSVTIPNSVTSIGSSAFEYCSGLTSVTIGRNVKSIGNAAFYKCSGLTSLIIPNSVNTIESFAFGHCYGLTSITIPNSVTSIGNYAFSACRGLISVTISNSLTSISNGVFGDCRNLTSVTIPNSVTSIGERAFQSCTDLISVTIPSSVTSIGSYAFYECSSLTSVTIPNGVTSIGEEAFCGIDMQTIISQIENPFKIYGKSSDSRVFTTNTFNNAALYVPKGTIDKYKATEGWKDFLFIEEGTGPNGGGETPQTKKCAKPTIRYQNGKLTFNCETEGATCHYTITDDDIKSGNANEIQLGVTYRISVYATKSGYENSETATATLCWIDANPTMEGTTDYVTQISSKAALIKCEGGILKVEGIKDGTLVFVYSLDGKQAGSAVSRSGTAYVSTNIPSGNTAIVKIGEKAIKFMMK